MKKRNFIFDFDGVIINSHIVQEKALRTSLTGFLLHSSAAPRILSRHSVPIMTLWAGSGIVPVPDFIKGQNFFLPLGTAVSPINLMAKNRKPLKNIPRSRKLWADAFSRIRTSSSILRLSFSSFFIKLRSSLPSNAASFLRIPLPFPVMALLSILMLLPMDTSQNICSLWMTTGSPLGIIPTMMPHGAMIPILKNTTTAIHCFSFPAIMKSSMWMFPGYCVSPVPSDMIPPVFWSLFMKWKSTCPLSNHTISASIPPWTIILLTAFSKTAASLPLLTLIPTGGVPNPSPIPSALTRMAPCLFCRPVDDS